MTKKIIDIDEFIESIIDKYRDIQVIVSDLRGIRSDKRFYGSVVFSFDAGKINPRVKKNDSLDIVL